jgi:2-polyprenyl-3-methyl-5-hydroxy-6-metoxy-1,4-benzoquinol methylase
VSLPQIDYEAAPKETVPCACCGSRDFLVSVVGDRYGFGLQTVVCGRCGLIFTNPRPSPEWFESFYRLHYRTYYEDVETPDEAYLSKDWVRGRQRRNVAFLRGCGLPATGRLLDVGSAEGTFLRLFEDAFPGWEAHGVEPSASFSAFARSHYGLRNVTTSRLEDLDAWQESTFDLLTISHVLEHLLNPDWFFRTARRMLKPGGLLFVDVPDVDGESRGLGNLHIAHVYHFSRGSLENFLTRHGFDVVSAGKGGEVPQWTFQVLARRTERIPESWSPRPVSADRIARAFRRYAGHERIGTAWIRRARRAGSQLLRGRGGR